MQKLKKFIKNISAKITKKTFCVCAITVAGAFLLSFFITIGFRMVKFCKLPELSELDATQEEFLNIVLDNAYPERTKVLHPLFFDMQKPSLNVFAESAIAVNLQTGSILYEKNADEIIPPASMTKLFVMYVIMEEIEKGNASFSDIVPLPPETWACNQPPHSSLMFLGKNQKVTLKEVIIGLDVCSGNDAATAIALYLFGDVNSFVQKINDLAESFDLKNTHFYDASGYSEKNTTTAREMATFARSYINRFPKTLEMFHSVPGFKYPKEINLSPQDKVLPTRFQDFSNGLPANIYMPIYQKNTNPLLGILEGCTGLKTGYIEESGYNLALTVKRENMHVLSITMKGPGSTVQEGQNGRIHDGKEIMEWAFSTFKNSNELTELKSKTVPLFCSKDYCQVNLIPAWKQEAVCIPLFKAKDAENVYKELKTNVVLPSYLKGEIQAGAEYGKIEWYLNDTLLLSVPFVADRPSKKACWWICAADFFTRKILTFFY